ncbi:MAG: VOC family protein [Gemmatimonadales bacterium]|jgi:hypothetical protein|nr:VOC family protein [Gemmatimonadales bacterium]
MGRVVHFEIHAEDPERAAAFYRDLLGWRVARWDGPMEYWTVVTGPDGEPGINGGLLRRRGTIDGTAVIAYVCTAMVDNVEATLARATALGGSVAVPTMPIPGMGWLGYVKDTEGNIVGVMQSDPSAR